MAESIIGPASDFWRLRLTRIDESSELDFEWHEDILWRTPDVREEPSDETWRVEAVSFGHVPEIVEFLAEFPTAEEARDFLTDVDDDLRDLTRSQFEAKHFTSAEG